MLKKLKKQEGFTIIEVMIVLAIAALILLIVLLAVPALQRNSRNTQRKNDVAALTSAINNFMSNNSATLPDTITVAADGTATISNSTIAGSASKEFKFGYYTNAQTIAFAACGVTSGNCTAAAYGVNTHSSPLASLLFSTASAAAPPTPTVGPDNVTVLTGAKCQSGSTVPKADNPRSYAIMYELEQSGSTPTASGIPQCSGS